MDLFVSIHAPTRGATQNRFSLSGYTSVFQSTHPHGVRLQALATRDSTKEFQSTHPHGVRHNKQHNTNTPIMFQSTHPHGVRRHLPERCRTTIGVSIHAPTRGATCPRQSALHRQCCFNPRTHTGCDVFLLRQTKAITVSIHAPTRGATR